MSSDTGSELKTLAITGLSTNPDCRAGRDCHIGDVGRRRWLRRDPADRRNRLSLHRSLATGRNRMDRARNAVCPARYRLPRSANASPSPSTQGDVPRLTDLGSLYLGASVLNLSFPGPAGEVAAGVVLQRTHKIPATLVIASSLHARFVALLVVAWSH